MCRPDLAAYMRTLPEPTLAPPPGRTWGQLSNEVAEQEHASQECSREGLREQSTGLRSLVLWRAEDYWLTEAHVAHLAGQETKARDAANHFADFMDAQAALGVMGDDNWKPVRDAARRGDWALVGEFWLANSSWSPGGSRATQAATR